MGVLNFARDSQGYNAFAPAFADIKYQCTLSDGTAQSVTVPSAALEYIVVFCIQPGTDVWVARNATATIPSGATPTVTSSELNPGPRRCYPGDTISVITDNTTADLGIMFYVPGS